MEQKLIDSIEDPASIGVRPVLGQHRLCESGLFDDGSLTDLLNKYPRERLQAFTMGTDPLLWKEWQPVDTAGSSGEDLFAAVTAGRLWLNILRVDLFDHRYRD